MKHCNTCECPTHRAVEVRPATTNDGHCNACGADEYGRPEHKTKFHVHLSTRFSGGMTFRLCAIHAAELVKGLGRG